MPSAVCRLLSPGRRSSSRKETVDGSSGCLGEKRMDKNSENLLQQGFPEAVEYFYSLRRFRQRSRKPEIIEVTLHKGDCAGASWKDRLRKDAASGGYRVPGLRRFPLWPENADQRSPIHGGTTAGAGKPVLCLPVPEYELCHGTFLPGFYFSACRKQGDSLYGRTHGENPRLRQLPGWGAPSPGGYDHSFERRPVPGIDDRRYRLSLRPRQSSSMSRKMPASTRTPSSGSWRRTGRSFSFPPMIRSWPCPVKNGSSLKTAESGELSPAQRRKRSF